MQKQLSFKDCAIVSCGTLAPELNYLRKEGFLDAKEVVYTTPGRHEVLKELESQLIQKINTAKQHCQKIIVVYGGKFCYVNSDDPTRTMQTIIAEQGSGVTRIQATHCIDLLAGEAERKKIAEEVAGGEKVWWMTPGWIKFRHHVFKDWDMGLANENFPRHTGGAIILDGIEFMENYMAEKPEEFLEYADWMGIPIQPYPITLDRFKSLLLESVVCLSNKQALKGKKGVKSEV